MVTGGGGAVAWGSPKKKLGMGAYRDGQGGGGRLFGQWWLAAQGVEVEDELQALDFVSNGYKID